MNMKLKTAFMSGFLNARLNSLIDVLENPENHSAEEVRDALSKAIDILKAIAGYLDEKNLVESKCLGCAKYDCFMKKNFILKKD